MRAEAEWTIEPLKSEERAQAIDLLAANSLPTDDLRGRDATLLAAHHLPPEATRPAFGGVIGLERFGEVGLLRSLAVRRELRGRGLGVALVRAIEALASRSGVRSLYLLTTTAEAFFAANGYARLERDRAPEAIRGTSEFSSVCPKSAVFMGKRLLI